MMTGYGMGFGLLGLLFMLLFWGGLILLAVWLVKALIQGSRISAEPLSAREHTAREILERRYARGEIHREQYEIMKREIDSKLRSHGQRI